MPVVLSEIIKRALETGEKGPGKVLRLDEAVRRHVMSGTRVHLAGGIGGASAAICEIIRQFAGKNPQLTVIQSTLAGHALNLIHCGIVKKLICAVCADLTDTARPSRIVQKALENGTLELENWSLCSLQQRLMAGAFGVPFMPTRSVLGSSIASDNETCFKELEDPFGSGTKTGMVKALSPDISIVHGAVADEEGNTILAAPYGEDLWGPLASRNGVLVTVEALVPTEFIKKYSTMVKIPGNMVRAVSVAPLGLHPFSFPNPGISNFDSYEKDLEFLKELHNASKAGPMLDAWIQEWIVDCPSHDDYLTKLGQTKISTLRQKAQKKNKTFEIVSFPGIIKATEPEEMMLIAVAREIMNSVRNSGHTMILAGAGAGATAAFLAYYQLKATGLEIELVTGNGQIAYTPIPGESILMTEEGVRSSKILSDTVTTQGVFVGGENNRCLSVLGAGQIDKYGNVNSTRTSQGKFLVGSGGANDALNAREVILVLAQSKERFVEEVSYVTGRGVNVKTAVSTMGIFRKEGSEGEFQLAACFPVLNPGNKDRKREIEEVQACCGWTLKVKPELEEVSMPTEVELGLLRWLLGGTSNGREKDGK